MLETIKIKNFAIIESAEIPFSGGLNILSGETGAGKSIIIEAISLILGSRASAEMVRSGCDEAVVEGLFDVSSIPWMKKRLETLGFDSSARELLIKRTVHTGGRHRIYVNGELATVTILQQLCEGLVDLCGQHEHQQLTRSPVQLELLDQFGELEKDAARVAEFHGTLRSLEAERDRIRQSEQERSQRVDYLKFQLQELRDAALRPGEDAELQQEKQLLQSAETRVQNAEAARQALEDEDSGVLSSLRTAVAKLRTLHQLDDRTSSMQESLERSLLEAEDTALGLNRYLGSVDLNTERLEEIQTRLSLIADFRRKYGSTIEEMLETQERIEKEFAMLDRSEQRLGELEGEISAAREAYVKICRKLSAARKKAAEKLSEGVSAELRDLKMAEARFQAQLSPIESESDWTATGCDEIQFLVQPNKGEPAKSIGKIASGGELSRLMLAVRRVISDRGGIGVYLFDEIDAGIGGQTAFQVGKKLKSVARSSQVLCITHLPQVAAFADHHLAVQKATRSGRTVTEVVELKAKERKEELARMLGGPELTRKSLDNASELLETARI